MSDADQAQERTEEPTPRRREQAKREGQVVRSRELNTMSVMLAGGGGLLAFGPWMMEQLQQLLVRGLTAPLEQGFAAADGARALAAPVREALLILAPLGGVLLLAALLGPVLLGGIIFSPKALAPQFDRLNPVSGLKRVFSLHGLMELAKTLLKFGVLTGLAAALLAALSNNLLSLGLMPALEGMAAAAKLIERAFIVLSAGLALIAAVDVPFQIRSHLRRLRMSRQEIKEELKETEGSPEVRAKVRRIQQQAARRRMMSDVPRADVVLTNPTHYAVALRYTDRPDRAPRVVAKGRGLVALKIRELAGEHRVAICEAPALTRAIHEHTDIGGEIPAGLYLAVARVLAYVFELRTARESGARTPDFPADLPVPEELAVPAEAAP